jgi:hypothetical protein
MWEDLVSYVSKQIPGFEIKTKEGSSLMKLLSLVLFFNKFFATRYVTTMYPKVYFPKEMLNSGNILGNIIILCHEYVHLLDRKRLGWLFNILYLSPQIFALLAFLAIPFSLSWLWCLLFLLPLPSPFRAYFEFRAYKMSIAIYYLHLGRLPPLEFYVKQFTTSSYYWMFPFQEFLYFEFDKYARDVKNKKFDKTVEEIKFVLFPNKYGK